MVADLAVRVRLLEHPTDEEIEEATAVAVRAFPWDNIAISMTGNKPELFPHIYRMQFGAACVAGRIYVISPQGSDKILAAGLWFGPGTNMMNSEEQRAAGYTQFLDMLDEATRHWWTSDYPEALKAVDAAYGKEGILPSWYANLIATDPEHQGKGYGTLLVQAGIRCAEEDNTFAALGTSSQKLADWYKYLGFKQFTEMVIDGPKTYPQIKFWATWLRCDDPENHI